MLRSKPVFLAIVLTWPATAFAHDATYKFKTIDYKTGSTILHGINASGTIVGDWTDQNGNQNCFLVTGKTKTALSDPNGLYTACINLNKAGTVAGYYVTSSTNVGFLYSGSAFTDVPGPKGAVLSEVFGVSDKGVVIGAWVDGSNAEHGFLLKGSKYTTFNAPNSVDTIGISVNASGDYTAQGFDSQNNPHSYLTSGGKTIELIFPGASITRVHAINNTGQVALAWLDGSGLKHGGVYDSKAATYAQIDVPGASATGVFGINDKQTLVGFFEANGSSQQQGFEATGKP